VCQCYFLHVVLASAAHYWTDSDFLISRHHVSQPMFPPFTQTTSRPSKGLVRVRAGRFSPLWVVNSPSPRHHRPALVLPAPSPRYKVRPSPRPLHLSSYSQTATSNRLTAPLTSLSPALLRASQLLFPHATSNGMSGLPFHDAHADTPADPLPHLHHGYQVDRRA